MARSRDLPAAAAFAAGLLALGALGSGLVSALSALLRSTLSAAGGAAPPTALLADASARAAAAAAPLLLVPALAATAAAAITSGLSVSLEPLRPRLDRLDPAAGLRRLLAPSALAAPAGLGVAKAAVLLWILWLWLAAHWRSFAQLPRVGAQALPRALANAAPSAGLALAALLFGLADLALARRRHRRGLMMTRDEVRRESREDEGDPQHRAERRRLHRAALDADPVAKATVVVVNPTHVAVALQHRRDRDEAPRLLAKGTAAAAGRIRSAARRAGVPIVRDVALARAVARLVDVGEELPPELYEAAAAVLIHLYGAPRP